MTLAGHTLGTPDMSVLEAIRLFRTAGLQAAEVIWQDGYRSGLPEADGGRALSDLRHEATDEGVTICCLTPYMVDLNSLDPERRERDMARFRCCIDDAEKLGAHRIRVYAGTFRPEERDQWADRWDKLIESLMALAAYASSRGVVLAVENHFSTMTITAQESLDLMRAVGSEAVGILYDQANLTFTHSEDPSTAIELQRRWIRHVHVKDLVFTDPQKAFVAGEVALVKESERSVRSRVVGDGILDWPDIIHRLGATGYDGFLSLEYEYRWHPEDLPDPAEGFRRSVTYLRTVASEIL